MHIWQIHLPLSPDSFPHSATAAMHTPRIKYAAIMKIQNTTAAGSLPKYAADTYLSGVLRMNISIKSPTIASAAPQKNITVFFLFRHDSSSHARSRHLHLHDSFFIKNHPILKVWSDLCQYYCNQLSFFVSAVFCSAVYFSG